MFIIELEGFELEEYETIEEVKEALVDYVRDDMADDNYTEESYSIYTDGEFYGYAESLIDIDDLESEYEGDWSKSNKYIELLEEGKFTQEMIKDVLYAINKKAKNNRDIIRAYYNNPEFKNQVRVAIANKKAAYRMKDEIIKHFPIVAIHNNSYQEYEVEVKTVLAVVDVYGYKAHTIITTEEAKKLQLKGLKEEETNFFNEGADNKELLNDRVIDLFMDEWELLDKNTLQSL